MSKFIRTGGGGSKNSLQQGNKYNKNLCLFTDIEDLFDVDVDVGIDVDTDVDVDVDVDVDDDDDDDVNINPNKSLETTKLIDDSYYFNNSTGNKYKFKIEPTDKVWKLNDHIKQNINYLYKISRNFPKLGGSSTNIFHIDKNDISYLLRYYYMYAILDTLKNDNNKLSEYLCSVIYSLYNFIQINNQAFDLNKKIKLFLNLFSRV
jgi:hypothetical protein